MFTAEDILALLPGYTVARLSDTRYEAAGGVDKRPAVNCRFTTLQSAFLLIQARFPLCHCDFDKECR